MLPHNNNLIDDDFDLDDANFIGLENAPENDNVVLDPYNADLNIKISCENRLVAEPFIQDGFAFMLASVRASHGFGTGKIGFEIKILDIFDVSNAKLEETYSPEIRLGFSTWDSCTRLGESTKGFAYCQDGKKATDGRFVKYGTSFGKVGDVIAALLDLDCCQVSFMLNGSPMDVAFELGEEWTSSAYAPPLYPHVTVKNVKFVANFGVENMDEKYGPWPGLPDSYLYPNQISAAQRFPMPLPPATKADCTVLCMIGLPGSGKTTWVENFVKEHSMDRYYVLSAYNILDQMKIQGTPRKKLYHGRWDMMMGAVVKCLNRMILLACRMRRNYILDMTNCYSLPRRKKMMPFQGFFRRAVVVVPGLEDYANRCQQQMRVEGKQMPSDAILEMKACFMLPKDNENEPIFDEAIYVELPCEEAQKIVEFYNEEGKPFKPRDKRRRGDFQQEELPPEIAKKYKTAQLALAQAQAEKAKSLKLSAANGVIVTAYEKSSKKSKSTSSSTSGLTTPCSSFNNSVPPSPAPSFPNKSSSATFTPRAGWPASWPQALWRGPSPATPTSQTPQAPTSGSSTVFPRP